MKSTIAVITFLGLSGLMNPQAQAEENGLYVDAGIGSLRLDFDDATLRTGPAGPGGGPGVLQLDFDSVTAVGLAGGYNWGRWALEFEVLQGLGDPAMQYSNAGGAVSGDFDYRDFRLAGVYRSAGQLYFLGKLGLSFPDLDSNTPGLRLKMGDSAFYGIGGGYRLSEKTALELEYTRSQDDVSFFSLGFRYHF